MKKNYLSKNLQSRLQAYNTMLTAYNSGKLSAEQQKTLIKLSSLIIQELAASQIRSKKQNLMDAQNLLDNKKV